MSKKISLIIVSFALLVSVNLAQDGKMKTLYNSMQAELLDQEPKLSSQQTRKLLKAALGSKWQKGNQEVGGYSDKPRISQAISGSFTAPRAREIAYLIEGSGAIPVRVNSDAGNDSRLVIFSGNRIVFNKPLYSVGALRISDLNGDGVDELLVFSEGHGAGGASTTGAQLVQVKGRRLRVIKDFGAIEDNHCPGNASKNFTSSIIRYSPAKAKRFPRFRVDYYSCSCPDDSTAKAQKCQFVQNGKISQ